MNNAMLAGNLGLMGILCLNLVGCGLENPTPSSSGNDTADADHTHDDLEARLEAVEAALSDASSTAALEEQVVGLEENLMETQAQLEDAQEALALVNALLPLLSVEAGDHGPVVLLSGANLQVVNGEGSTETVNGLGNVIIGYDEATTDTEVEDVKEASHSIIAGKGHRYEGYGGIITGEENYLQGNNSVILATTGSSSASDFTVILAGYGHEISALAGGAILGGANHHISSLSSGVIVSGNNHTLGAPDSSDGDGTANHIFIGGGVSGVATADYATVLGGSESTVTGEQGTVVGGESGWAAGQASLVAGGSGSKASGYASLSAGGEANDAQDLVSSVVGGGASKAVGRGSTVVGGYDRWTSADYATSAGGVWGGASGMYALAAGGNDIACTTVSTPGECH